MHSRLLNKENAFISMLHIAVVAASTVLCLLVGYSHTAAAQDTADLGTPHPDDYSNDPKDPGFEPYSPYYNGSFLGLGAFAGPAYISTEDSEAVWSTLYGAFAQLSTPLQVIDLQASWLTTEASTPLASGQALSLKNHSFSGAVGLHPLFLIHLESSVPYYILGGFYLLAGVDIDFVNAEAPAGNNQEAINLSETHVGYQLGAGIDVPIDDVDNGESFWIGLQYRFNQWAFDAQPLRQLDVSQHLTIIRLTYRHNGLILPF